MSEDFLKKLFIDDVKGSLHRGGGGGSNVEIATDYEVLALLASHNIVTPIVDDTGAIYIDKNRNILTI